MKPSFKQFIEEAVDREPKFYLATRTGLNAAHKSEKSAFDSEDEARAHQNKYKHIGAIRSAAVVRGKANAHGYIRPAR